VTIIVFEKGVVDMMVGRRPKSDTMEELIPRKCVFGMNQCQPVGVQAAKGHIGPDIAIHQIRGGVEWYQNHENGIQHRTVEGIKEAWIGEFVVGFVRILIKGGRDIVFQ